MSAKTRKSSSSPTVITLTLPQKDDSEGSGTLLIQRGDLAHMRQFTYTNVNDMAAVIKAAYLALSTVEAEPPVIPETPKTTPKAEAKPKTTAKAVPQPPVVEEEPTIDIPLKKGMKTVKISHLKIVGGETDAAAYKQAVLIAGKLIDGGLWDGGSPIRIADVYATAKKMKHLTEREMSLFALEDFVQVGESGLPQDAADVVASMSDEDDQDILEVASVTLPASFNGFHPDDESE
ncbi:MAG: hypothetical protein JNJ61_30715 [Anaerolineae bacterium]|nr:hypothetical protein [Anaerolineae bacterium]